MTKTVRPLCRLARVFQLLGEDFRVATLRGHRGRGNTVWLASDGSAVWLTSGGKNGIIEIVADVSLDVLWRQSFTATDSAETIRDRIEHGLQVTRFGSLVQ